MDVREWSGQLGRFAFGDRIGLVVFLGTLCFVGLYWRAGLFITDNRTLVEALAAIVEGHLWIDRVGENAFAAPGAVRVDELIFGRNYAQVVAAVPLLVLLRGLEVLADLRVGLTALWHLALLALVVQVGRVFDTRSLPTVGGSAVVLVSFVANLVLATQFVDPPVELLALHLSTLLAAALLAVLVYRLVANFHGTRLAATTGLASGIVLPIGFWAVVPKRHVLSALLIVGIVYAFARSRTNPDKVQLPLLGAVPGSRALAYVLVGLLTWLHAAEAIFVFVPLLLVDLPTAPSNDRKTLTLVAGAFLVSLLPFFLTNFAISGNPIRPPRTLPPADATIAGTADSLSATGFDFYERVPGGFVLEGLVWLTTSVSNQVAASLATATDPDALYRTYLRSGTLEIVGSRGVPEFRAVNLSVLESVPLFGGLVAVGATVGGATRRQGNRALRMATPTGLLAAGIIGSFLLLYTQRLPIHAQITVRYLVPVFPLGLYLLVRQPHIRAIVTDQYRLAIWTYGVTVLLGTQLLLAYVVATNLTVAAAAQVHAILGLGAAIILAVTVILSYVDDRAKPFAAVALGLAAAAGTAFILLTGLAYFSFTGEYVLPASQAVSDLIGRI